MTPAPPEPLRPDESLPEDPRIEEIAETYWERLLQGERPDRKTLAAAHPEIADVLEERLALVEMMIDVGSTPGPPPPARGGDETTPLSALPTRPTRRRVRGETSPPGQLGAYKILDTLGEGGMGVVHLALDGKLGRKVAIKVLADEFSDDPDRLALFEREARTLAHLNHPNIATIYELGEHGESYFIAMEYIEGRPLSDLLDGEEPIPLGDLLDIAVQMAHGLTAAHEKDVIHRDLKPANVMITEDGRVKLLDFGLAKPLHAEAAWPKGVEPSKPLAMTSAFFGTPGYSSPEQCRGEPVDVRGDLFSFGVVLYELSTGVAPFERADLPTTIRAVLDEEPPPPGLVNANLPGELESLIGKLLSKRPEDRYQSSDDLLLDLETMERRFRMERERPGRRIAWAIGLGAVLIVLAIGLPMLVGKPPPAADPRIDELLARIVRGEIAEARGLLAVLEEELGYELMMDARERLGRKTDEILGDDLDALDIYLADGEFPKAETIVAAIEALDEGGPRGEKARRLLEDARDLQKRTDELDRSVLTSLAAAALPDAWEGIRRLGEVRFQDEAFGPAVESAEELTGELTGRLEERSRKLTDPTASPARSEIESVLRLLETVDPGNAHLDQLREGVARLRLRELHDGARPGMTVVELRDIVREMEGIDRESDLTARVWKMHQQRRQQTASFVAGLEEFREGSREGLATAVHGHGKTSAELPSPEASRELAQLEGALAWLDDYQRALDAVGDDLDQATRRHAALDPDALPWTSTEFVAIARMHRQSLLESVQVEKARQLCRGIETLCDRRRLVEAKAALADLDALPAPRRELPQAEAARARVQRLDSEENERRQLESRYARFVERLRGNLRPDPQLARDLDLLEHRWRTERERLGAAIELEPRAALLQRRATLSLRLGEPDAALEDTRRSLEGGATAEGHRLHAVALAASPTGRAAPEALKAAREAARLEGKSAVAVALSGVILYEQFLAGGSKDLDRLAESLQDLTAAVDDRGLVSAHALYCLAMIHLERASIDLEAERSRDASQSAQRVVSLAKRAREAPLTEQEILVALGGNRAAAETHAVRDLQRDIVLASAEAHLIRKDFDRSIADFDRAIEIDDGPATSYFRRARAKGEAGRYAEALLDLTEADGRADDDEALRELIELWRKEYRTAED